MSEKIPLHQTLGALQVGDRPLFIVLRLTVRSSAEETKTSRAYEGTAKTRRAHPRLHLSMAEARAIEQYTRQLESALDAGCEAL